MSTIDRTRVNVVVQQTAQRVTPPPAGRQFSEAIARGGQVVVRAAIAAVSHVPGMDVAAAALRGAGIGADPSATPSGPVTGGPSASTSSTSASGSVSPEGGPASAGTNGAASAAGVTSSDGDLLSRGQEMSMRMLRLQEAMGEENRRYTALSNVMHARHEMSKNAINNIR
ncbi:MAG: hypothetical protein JNK05_08540 [Myxococcales bacterium]|nr:hypothetical protein [Myxococcales bacterium]